MGKRGLLRVCAKHIFHSVEYTFSIYLRHDKCGIAMLFTHVETHTCLLLYLCLSDSNNSMNMLDFTKVLAQASHIKTMYYPQYHVNYTLIVAHIIKNNFIVRTCSIVTGISGSLLMYVCRRCKKYIVFTLLFISNQKHPRCKKGVAKN